MLYQAEPRPENQRLTRSFLRAAIVRRGVNQRKDFRAGFRAGHFEFERVIAQMNKSMVNEVETIFFLTTPELSAITSTVVRDIIKNRGDASMFVPKGIRLD